MRSMIARLKKLEAEFGDVEHACLACGYPANAVSVAIAYADQPIERCEECGRQLSPEGQPFRPKGRCVILHD